MNASADALRRFLLTNVIKVSAQDSALLVLMLPMQLLLDGSRRWITRKNDAVLCLVARINKIFEPRIRR